VPTNIDQQISSRFAGAFQEIFFKLSATLTGNTQGFFTLSTVISQAFFKPIYATT